MNESPFSLSLTLACGGRTIYLARDSEYRIVSLSGLESAVYRVFAAENVQSDGASIRGRRVAPRTIGIVFAIDDEADTETHRSSLIRFFRPDLPGTLTVTRNGVVREIGYELTSVVFSQPTLFDPVRIEVSLLCPDPFFASPSLIARVSAETVPLLTFPLTSPAGFGVTSGLRRRSLSFSLVNSGDADAGLTAILTADGTIVNPFLSCEGKVLTILDTMQSGDTYEISTAAGARYLKKNGLPVYCFERSSRFITLSPGVHTVTVGCESGEESLFASLSFRTRHLSI